MRACNDAALVLAGDPHAPDRDPGYRDRRRTGPRRREGGALLRRRQPRPGRVRVSEVFDITRSP
ncbi:MAG: hypothetical protein U5R48_18060 [Gammaproteobacteria bacterium]|nr:hypothetical protein [Gammaproteobacteria bacterium]